ncbi:hypothetical protein RsY01_1485 [Lactococcus reticulitermitis]|uniref:WxL domain-containing protein n=2 Tax=Pseudolactococcus reticulitermitis TaxID=2025039 RepID=A0A224XE76_9LACT|nr:hypothetical protein RsY01_1485 [Lactococcus reticulitermitis]
MNKKQLTSLAGLALGVTLLVTPAFADTYTNGSWGGSEDGKTDVTVTVAPTYTITIPASFSFTAANAEQNANVAISKDSQLNANGSLEVKMTSTLAAIKTYSANTSTIPFTLAYGASKTPYTSGNTTILTKTGAEIGVATTDLTETVYVNVPSLASATIAGEHAGTVDFSVIYTLGS